MKSKDQKSKKSKDQKAKKDDGSKSDKSASKSKGKDKEKVKEKEKSKTPSKVDKQSKAKKPSGKDGKDNASDISSISQAPVAPADCIHHKSPFINFCETCEELVCNQCTVYGPHNNHLHRILKMTDAYRLRKFYLVEAIRSNLVDKRDKIIAQLHRLQYRIQEIRFVKNIIERDVRSEYSGILERLKSYEGVKLANLTHQVSLVQRQVDTINDIGNTFFQLTNMDCEKIQQERKLNKFLVKSKEMYENIEYITTKTDKQLPDIGVSKIPRQVQQNREIVKKALAGKEINAMKNQVLWKLSLDLKNDEILIKKEVQEKANGIIRDLSDEVEHMNLKLIKNKLICYFCSIKMNRQSVNAQCPENYPSDRKDQQYSDTQKKAPQNYKGNRRHFFSRLSAKS